MKPKSTSKEIDVNEMAISFDVDSELIDDIRSGKVKHLRIDICDDNQNLVLENVDGNLVLDVDELPNTFHGCYFYNDGVFPYIIKRTLNFLVLNDGKSSCLTRIIGVETTPGTRFRFQDDGKGIKDPKGDSCIWTIDFEVIPVPEKPRTYLMRWNPVISSFTEQDYKDKVANLQNGTFRLNWSIREWEEARRGDIFYMLRTGDNKAGIVFNGQFASDPYPAEDWGGTDKRRMYVDLICTKPVAPNKKPRVSMQKLQELIPDFDWANGHSGALLSDEVADKLEKLFC